MGDYYYKPDILSNRITDYNKLFEIKDFLLLTEVIEHLENILLKKEATRFHLCTIIYTKEDLKRLQKKGG